LLPTAGKAEQTLEHLAGRVSQHISLHFFASYPNLSRGHAAAGAQFKIHK